MIGKSPVLCLQKKIRILKSWFPANDGGRSSMVEPQIVVLVVAGSSPVGHPPSQIPNPKLQTRHLGLWDLEVGILDLQSCACSSTG